MTKPARDDSPGQPSNRHIVDTEAVVETLRRSLFEYLPEAKLRELLDFSSVRQVSPELILIQEGEKPEHLHMIVRGEVEVLGRGKDDDALHTIRTLGDGETVGEPSLIEPTPALATIRVVHPSTVLSIPIATLRERMEADPVFAQLYRSLAKQLTDRLRHTSATTIESIERELNHAQTRVSMGMLLMTLVLMLSLFTYLLELMAVAQEMTGNTLIATIPVAVISLIAAVINMRVFRFPLSFYGLTLKNWRRATFEGVLFSVPFLALALLGKWLLITYVAGFEDMELLHFGERWRDDSLLDILVRTVLYVGVSVAAQEFIARGAIQGCLQQFLLGPYRVHLAILCASLIFSVTHVFISAIFGVLTFVLGCFWGWLYYRHKTLIGAYVSHVLIGLWGLEIMGIGMSNVH